MKCCSFSSTCSRYKCTCGVTVSRSPRSCSTPAYRPSLHSSAHIAPSSSPAPRCTHSHRPSPHSTSIRLCVIITSTTSSTHRSGACAIDWTQDAVVILPSIRRMSCSNSCRMQVTSCTISLVQHVMCCTILNMCVACTRIGAVRRCCSAYVQYVEHRRCAASVRIRPCVLLPAAAHQHRPVRARERLLRAVVESTRPVVWRRPACGGRVTGRVESIAAR